MKIKVQESFKIFIIMLMLSICLCPFQVYGAEDSDDETIYFSREYVVVLDSGHDTIHYGARGNGIKEEKVNMTITQYCKEALEQYENITVYLTHEDLKCPFPGTEASECNKSRCEFAASVNADLFISIHANSNASRSRGGFEIIYPNTHYKAEYNVTGEKLSNYIVEELKKTGLRFRNIWTRNSTEYKKDDENYYPDGSRADYYNVIRNSKYNDILGIIIEHGYLSNYNDAKNFLSSEEMLKQFGEADAQGIINYLLSIEEEERNNNIKNFLNEKLNDAKDFLDIFRNAF